MGAFMSIGCILCVNKEYWKYEASFHVSESKEIDLPRVLRNHGYHKCGKTRFWGCSKPSVPHVYLGCLFWRGEEMLVVGSIAPLDGSVS